MEQPGSLTMVDDILPQFERWFAAALAPLQPAVRRQLTRALAIAMRRRQVKRIAAQRNPDGSPYVPRRHARALRTRTGRIKRTAAMFRKLRTANHLRARGTADAAIVEFRGRDARIARAHQFGRVDQAGSNGPRVRNPQRQLLGFSDDDREFVRDWLLEHLRG